MSAEQFGVSPQVVAEIPKQLEMLVRAQRATEIATLAAAIIGQSGKAWTVEEVTSLRQDLWFTYYPEPGNGRWQAWNKARKESVPATP